MAEEVLYEVEQGGDPDPLGLRKKLKQVKPDRADPLGLRPKLAQQEPEASKAESQPAFKPMTDWLNIPQQGYQPMDQANIIPIDDHTLNTAKAADRIRKEIETIDPHIGNLIYDKKKELTGRIKSQELGINPKEAGPLNPQAALLESKMRDDVVVHPEEIEEYKAGMAENNGMLRDAVTQKIKDLYKTDVPKANQLKADMYRVDAQDRVDSEKKIAKNAEKLQNGELEYDPRRGLLYKPEGFFPSIVTGFKQKNQLFKDYEFFTKTENESAIIKELNDRIKEQDPDTPAAVPDGALGEAGAMLGGQPIKPIVGAVGAGIATSGLGAAAAGAGIAAHEMYKLGYASALTNNYGAIKRQHPEMPDYEVYQQAKTLAEKQADTDALTGAAMGAIGAKGALKPTTSLILQKSVKSALKQIGETVAIEGLGGGVVGAGGQYIKNIMAQKAGIPVDETEGMTQQLVGGLFMTLGMSLAGKFGNLLKPSTYSKLLHPLSKLPEEAISNELTKAQEVGALTPEEVQKVQADISEQKKIDASVPENVSESERVKIHTKIKERDALQSQLETSDKAFHPEIKEKIKSLEEEIVNISKGQDRGELQQLVVKADKNGDLFGVAAKELLQHDEKTLKGFFKDIAEQANDPATEQLTIDTFGKEIVDKAKELYPKEEPKQSGITVIQPGEIKHPETITVSPREQPADIQSTDKVSVIMPKNKDNAISVESSLTLAEKTNGKQESKSNIIQEGEQAQRTVDREAETNSKSKNKERRNEATNAWLESIERNDPKAQRNIEEELFREPVSEGALLADNDLAGAAVRAPGSDGAGSGAKIKEERARTSQGRGRDEQSSGQSSASVTARSPQDSPSQAQARSMVKKLLEMRGVQGEPEAAQVARTLRSMLSESSNPNEIHRVIQEEIYAAKNTHSGQEEIGTPREIGITHRQMDAIAEELGLPTYEKSPEKIAEWDQRAAKMLAEDPQALPNLFEKLRRGDTPGPEETRMMLQYMGDLMAKVESNPYDRALQDQLLRTKDLFNIAGRLQGKGLAARKGSIPVEETLPDFIMRDREANQAPLTDDQITVSKREFEEMRAAKDAFEAKMAVEKEKTVKAKAEKTVQEEVKAAKKSAKKDYTNEREKIFTDIKEKLRKARGDTSVVVVPYAKELIAIAPDVMKLVKNYVEQGISELPELVKYVREALKEDIPHITEDDVHNIIAGEYNQKKPTRSQLAQQVYDLRKEASLINQLEDLQNGQIPASKNKQRQRNQKIEALRKQIKEVRDEMGLNEKTEAEKLSALKARYKSQISELEKKIAAGDYGPDVKPQPIVLDKEAIDLKDKMIKVKLDREARLAKQEYENRTLVQKAKDTASDALDAVRTLQTNPDLSFFGRQGIKFLVTHPIKGPKVFWESAKQALSQKRYDRWLFDMHNSAAWKLIEESGLAVLDPNTLHASQREEQWRSQLIHKIPVAGQVAKASERAFTSAANMARVDWFMEGVDILRKQGKTWENSPEEYKGWASAVNNMTGRGGLGALEPVVGQLAIPFWSPRLIAANVNLFLNPAYYIKMPKTARTMLIKNMAQYVVTGGAFLGLANALGADTEVDPRSSDFGKIKVGNTRYDIWGGASQYIRVFAQLGLEARKSGGDVTEIKPRQMITTGTNLVRTKLSPIWGFMIDAKLGENVVGEKVEWKDAYKLMIPMLWNDIQDAKKDSGPEAGAVAGLLSFLGIGASTYGGDKAGSGTSSGKPRKPGKPSKPSNATK